MTPPAEQAGDRPAALVGQGPAAGYRYILDRPVTIIGRAEDCDVQIQDPLASRRHAELRRESWRYLIADLGSRNGTLVNGLPLTTPHELHSGDTVVIAATPFRFEDPNATVAVARDELRMAHLPVWIDEAASEAYTFGRRLELAPKELSLLALLSQRAGALCEKDEIARAVWPEYQGMVSDYNIETLVSRLRHKLEQAGAPPGVIVTVKKRGYRLDGASTPARDQPTEPAQLDRMR